MTKPSADSAVEQGEKPNDDENQQHSIAQNLINDINHAFETLMHTETWGGKIRAFQINLRTFLEDPSSSFASMVFNISLAVLILLATIVMILESVDWLYQSAKPVWYVVDWVISACFLLELFLRLVSFATDWKSFSGYIFSFLFVVDVIAILPFYTEVIMYDTETMQYGRLTGVRAIRVFRILKMFKFVNQIRYIQISFEIAGESVRKSLGPLFPLFSAGGVVVIILATLVYYAERGVRDNATGKWINILGEESEFKNIPETIWFIVTTITTTGYGDMYPLTFWGRLLTFMTMISGMLLIALPSIIIGRNFSILWGNLKAKNAVPPTPDWLLKIMGVGGGVKAAKSKYQKLGHDDEDNVKKEEDDKKIRDVSHPGQDSTEFLKSTAVLESRSGLAEVSTNMLAPPQVKHGGQVMVCPSCNHRFHDKGKSFLHSTAMPLQKKRPPAVAHIETKEAAKTSKENNDLLLSPEISDMELLQMILVEVTKNSTMIKELLDQNNFDDQVLFQEADIDDEKQ